MIGKNSELSRILIGEEELERDKIKKFTLALLNEIEKIIQEQGKEEFVRSLI
ncbi:MAG: hypothetical protein LRY71_07685 [Bacillaceae bacterium]|nr:hypothetical protein [Bacillaceae bacterium]